MISDGADPRASRSRLCGLILRWYERTINGAVPRVPSRWGTHNCTHPSYTPKPAADNPRPALMVSVFGPINDGGRGVHHDARRDGLGGTHGSRDDGRRANEPTVMAMVLPAEVYAATPAIAGPTVIAPRAMMTMAAVAPSVVPVAVATPANLRRRRLGRCCGFQRREPCGCWRRQVRSPSLQDTKRQRWC